MTNINKLKGRIVEKGYSMSSFSEAVHISRPALRRRLTGIASFRASEIETVCRLLDIPRRDLTTYFFVDSCPQNGNKCQKSSTKAAE